MMVRKLSVLMLLLVCARTGESYPTPVDGDFVLRNFRFHSGETLPELRLHYRTIGQPRARRRGVVRNAVLVLHGTDGTGGQFRPRFAGELFGPGLSARRGALLHRPPGRHRPRRVEQAERRPAREVSALRLRRHGRPPSTAC